MTLNAIAKSFDQTNCNTQYFYSIMFMEAYNTLKFKYFSENETIFTIKLVNEDKITLTNKKDKIVKLTKNSPMNPSLILTKTLILSQTPSRIHIP